jgi:Fur family ferric uptake transcriptional regulator
MEKNLHRRTKQRRVILEELAKVTTHPTASDLYEMVRRRVPLISLGTVYRNLDLLSREGAVQKFEFAGSKTRFDATVARHNHVRCMECGRLDDLTELADDGVDDRAIELNGYRILGRRIEFFGLCPQCRERCEEIENT